MVAAAQTTGSRAWRVRLADGTGAELTVVANASGSVEFHNNKAVTLTIPSGAITGIVHSTSRIRRSEIAHGYFEKACCGGTDSQLLPALAAAVAAPLGHSKVHYVEIQWYFNGNGAVLLQLSKKDYAPFMDWLQTLSGTKWVDIAQQREEAIRQITKRAGGAFRVEMTDYPAGNVSRPLLRYYWALPIDLNDQNELYFFDYKVKPEYLVGILPVTEEWADNKCVREAAVLYGDCGQDLCKPEAVLLPALTYRVLLPPRVIETDATGYSESDCVKLARQAKRRQNLDSKSEINVRAQPK